MTALSDLRDVLSRLLPPICRLCWADAPLLCHVSFNLDRFLFSDLSVTFACSVVSCNSLRCRAVRRSAF